MPAHKVPIKERILEKTVRDQIGTGCWVWQGARPGGKPYGTIWFEGRHERAHRAAYRAWKGPIPDGLCIDHLCRNTLCVNPDHLEAVTYQENSRRGQNCFDSRRRCFSGKHDITQPNTVTTAGGFRLCVQCLRLREKKKEVRCA